MFFQTLIHLIIFDDSWTSTNRLAPVTPIVVPAARNVLLRKRTGVRPNRAERCWSSGIVILYYCIVSFGSCRFDTDLFSLICSFLNVIRLIIFDDSWSSTNRLAPVTSIVVPAARNVLLCKRTGFRHNRAERCWRSGIIILYCCIWFFGSCRFYKD